MKKNCVVKGLFLCIFGSFVFMFILTLNHVSYAQNYLKGELLLDIKREFLPVNVQVEPDSNIFTNLGSIDSLNALYNCFSFEKLYKGKYSAVQGLYLLKFPDTLDIDKIFSSYSQDTHIHLLSRSYPTEPAIIPNDSLYLPDPPNYRYAYQWSHNMMHMQSELGWDIARGYSTIVIMILDTGVDYWFHEFGGNIWQNLGEDYDGDGHTLEWDPINKKWKFDPGDVNSDDNDNNGYRDDFVGYDFYDDDNNPECENVYKGDHGDQVAGTSSAVTNNISGGAGTDWYAKVMIARESTTTDCISALAYAVDNGADVVNMSFYIPGFNSPSESLLFKAQIDSAYAHGLVLVAGAGNNNEEKLYPPAVYDNVIAVAGTDSFDLKWDVGVGGGSNYHVGVDLSAPFQNWGPGHDKWWEHMIYLYKSGTSISTPFVSALAALIKGQHLRLWGPNSITNS